MLTNPHLDQCDVLALIQAERAYQDRKWGSVADHPHEVGAWLLVMKGKLDAAIAKWQTTPNDVPALAELVKAVAVGVACMEQHGGNLLMNQLRVMDHTKPLYHGNFPSRRDQCYWPVLEAIRQRIKEKVKNEAKPN
jgi:hypothetical protein